MKTINLSTVLILLVFSFVSIAQVPPVDDKGLAIGGYDVVAYFAAKAVKGDPKIAVNHEGVTYQFSTIANRDAFKHDPAKYLPQYDGFCAWGVGAKSTRFPINPETYKIIDDKLYLFFNGPFNGSNFNALEAWNPDEDNLLKAASANWPKMKTSK